MTKIEWVVNPDGSKGETWNPLVGCKKISPGCANCYAERMAKRLKAMGISSYQDVIEENHWSGEVKLIEDLLEVPSKKKKPTTYFVNSMSDLFHNEVPFEFIQKVFSVMNKNPRHTFQVLTKRHKRLEEVSPSLNWTHNIWMGVSVENQDYIERVESLKKTEAHIKFLSCEPLLGPLDLDLEGIDWVIVGGESGPKFREVKTEWVESILSQCEEAKVPFFFKQWSGFHPKKKGNLLNEKTYQNFPKNT